MRRVVDGAVVLSLATASITGPTVSAIADEPVPVIVHADESGRPMPPGTSDSTPNGRDAEPLPDPPSPASAPAWTPTPAGPIDIAASPAPTSTARPTSVEVEPGDHLWSIAERHLTQLGTESPSVAAVTRYWIEVIETNRASLASGNPDLIYPGEIVMLPAIELEDRP